MKKEYDENEYYEDNNSEYDENQEYYDDNEGYYDEDQEYYDEEGYDDEEEDDDDPEDNKAVIIIKFLGGLIALLTILICVLVLVNKDKNKQFDSATHTHEYASEYTVDKAATCLEEGIESQHCKTPGCDAHVNERVIPKSDHSYNKGTVTKDATCINEGEISYTCTVCGNKFKETIPAKGHTYGPGTVTLKENCLHDGIIEYTCTVCGDVKTEAIPKTEQHDLNAATFVDETDPLNVKYYKTCKTCGAKFFTDKDGNIIDNTAVISNETNIDEQAQKCASGQHNFVEVAVTKAATCTLPGSKTYACTVCGAEKVEEIPKLEHEIEEIRVESTCNTQGTVTRKCKNCGYIESVVYLNFGEHKFENKKVISEGDCQHDRIIEYTCAVCGQQKREVETVSDGHDFETVTYVDNGETITETRCKICGIVTSKISTGNNSNVIVIND